MTLPKGSRALSGLTSLLAPLALRRTGVTRYLAAKCLRILPVLGLSSPLLQKERLPELVSIKSIPQKNNNATYASPAQ